MVYENRGKSVLENITISEIRDQRIINPFDAQIKAIKRQIEAKNMHVCNK
jgi:uncharacterized protein YjaZ